MLKSLRWSIIFRAHVVSGTCITSFTKGSAACAGSTFEGQRPGIMHSAKRVDKDSRCCCYLQRTALLRNKKRVNEMVCDLDLHLDLQYFYGLSVTTSGANDESYDP